ncbi:hypothetical protein J2Z31_005235 [Sinorhizobium kostiense]|uniref:Prokaryotic YEATS domain-containing protein n=1 Tax=Sinorhizobium kostiense TaxID=76747 RepID=A0ABS4R8Q4_9HYPH|nr:pYEATS domain-containing protein [Sinorhizobium kostiense]MBP2238694.1 hypothetical protein [Sinorhizobium kostiense]
MTSTLSIVAPSDMSIGRIRILGQEAQVGEWLATPTKTTCQFDVPPGIYTATVEPLGQLARSVTFAVHDGEANHVRLPTLRELAVTGDAFLNNIIDAVQLSTEVSSAAAETSAPSRWLSIAISQDTLPGRVGGWRPYRSHPEPVVTILGSLAELLIQRPGGGLDREHGRLRLEYAVSGLRNERLMLPLFNGGTKVLLRSTPSSDITAIVFPAEMSRRALVQALYAGSVAEAKQITMEQLEQGGELSMEASSSDTDPWLEIAVALLALRFPELERATPRSKIDQLVADFDWIPDLLALSARNHIDVAPAEKAEQAAAGAIALDLIAKCRRLGMPYFAYTAQIVGDMLNALSKSGTAAVSEKATDELAKWKLRMPAQKAAGASFSWLVTGNKLQPSLGNIDERFSKVVFRGRLHAGRFGVQSPATRPAKSRPFGSDLASQPTYSDDGVLLSPAISENETQAPSRELLTRIRQDPNAVSMQILEANDPHKGRWGGSASREGYLLSAEFIPNAANRSWVTVVLTVEADPDLISSSYDEPVEFFLHPTFHPDRIRTIFRGYRARIELGCYGGFTVGAWIPGAGVELELDLAELSDAPHIIKNF